MNELGGVLNEIAKLAPRLFLAATTEKDYRSMWVLGHLYQYGAVGFSPAPILAMKWFLEAATLAEQANDPESHYAMAVASRYSSGDLVAKDLNQAAYWYGKAAARGNQSALKWISEIPSVYRKKTGAREHIEEALSGAALDSDGENASSDGEGGDDAESDALYDQAVELVLKNRRASISLVQRHLSIGYNRSARLIESMEKAGLVSAMDERGGRDVIARKEES